VRKSSLLLVLFISLVSAITLASQTLVVAYMGEPISFNPCSKTDDYGAGIHRNIFNQLVAQDVNYDLVPQLATSWEVSDDGKEYTFYLREGVKWHDGAPFTSRDVKYTIEAIVSNKGSAYNNVSMVEEVVCLDDLTVVVKLSDPYAPFIPFLAWYGTQIMPAHLYEGTDWHDNPANQKPVGTGPFKFVEWTKGDHVTLVKNEEYWGEGPYVDRLVFKIIPDPNTALQSFLNGEADINVNRPGFSSLSILKRNPEVEVVVMSSPSRYYVGFNMTEEARPVTNLKVREAVAYAINKQTIVDRVLGGFGGIGEYFYTPAIPWAVDFDVKAQLYDPAKAEELLDEAGFPKDKDGWRFSVDLLYFQGADWTDMAAVIKENLEKVGIKVNLGEYEIATWIEKVLNAHNYDIALLNGFQGPDPENLTLRVSSGGGLNIMGYSNEVVDSNLKEAAKIADIESRKPYYYAVQAQLAADVPFVPLAEVSYIYIYKKYVEGMFIDNPGKVGNGDYSLIKLNF